MRNLVEFWNESKKELKKVRWPDRPKVVETSMVVGVCTLIFTVYLWLVDMGISQAFSFLFYNQ